MDVPPNSSPAVLPSSQPWQGEANVEVERGNTICVGTCRDRDFLIAVHRTVQRDLWKTDVDGRQCSLALNEAIYRQDIGEFYKAEAHFDNCAFDESLRYFEVLVTDAERKLNRARVTTDMTKNRDAVRPHVLAALTELGKALHLIQDFYAHTDYVELRNTRGNDVDLFGGMAADTTTVPLDQMVVPLWRQGGRVLLSRLSTGGLISGVVWYEKPRLNRCPRGAPSHHDLAKDAPDSPRGSQPSRRAGMTLHEIAVTLATHATREFILHMVRAWPEIPGICGNYLRSIVPGDQRQFPVASPSDG